jgi:polyhydroxybutyrate depolymerase
MTSLGRALPLLLLAALAPACAGDDDGESGGAGTESGGSDGGGSTSGTDATTSGSAAGTTADTSATTTGASTSTTGGSSTGTTAEPTGTTAEPTGSDTDPSPAGCDPALAVAPGEQNITITHDGIERSYLLYVPPNYDGALGNPLIVNFHGRGSDNLQQRFFSNMNDLAARENVLVAYPQGLVNASDGSRTWNAGTCCAEPGSDRDDVGFARAVVADIATRACVDPRRVYATGMSNGGFMSHLLACEASDLFAAVSSVTGSLGIPEASCTPARPMPVFQLHGTADVLVGYNGVVAAMDAWSRIDGCEGDAVEVTRQGDATCVAWQTCAAGTEVRFCTFEGMNHCWPGQAFCPYQPPSLDLSANDEMWAFFSRFTLP